MINPAVLRESVNEHLQNHLAYPADVMAWAIKCGDLLDENAALREKLETMQRAMDRSDNYKEFLALESRLAALKAAGEKVMKEEGVDDPAAPCVDDPCPICRAWDAFKAELRSDP